MIDGCHPPAQRDDALPDRFLQSLPRSRVVRHVQQDPFHALAPGVVLRPQMGQLLPDATSSGSGALRAGSLST